MGWVASMMNSAQRTIVELLHKKSRKSRRFSPLQRNAQDGWKQPCHLPLCLLQSPASRVSSRRRPPSAVRSFCVAVPLRTGSR